MNKTGFTLLSFGVILLILLVLMLKVPIATHGPQSGGQSTTTDTDIVDALPVSGQTTLALGETAAFKHITLSPTALVEDSRCATGVQCIWAGRVVVNLEFISAGRKQTMPIALGESITTESNKITFLSAEPYPTTKKQIALADYRFTFSVESHDPSIATQCYRGGCSGEICSDQKDVASTCIYREEFACYKTATCEVQSSGECGWISSSALTMCLSQAR